MSSNFLAGQASLWVQPNGPNTEPKYLGCHGIGDVTEPLGDKTLLYCPDPSAAGKYVVKNSYRSEPGAVTTSIETDIRATADYLEQLGLCGVPIYIHKVLGGRRDVFANFDRSYILYPADVTSRGLSNLASRTPGDENESMQSFEISADLLIRAYKLEAFRISITDPSDITGITVCGEERCEGVIGPAQKLEDYLFAATDVPGGSAAATADVLGSVSGAAFTPTAADPFGAAEDIRGIVCFKVGRETTRLLVARGTTDPANPAEIAYSDDEGATWTLVNVGSVNGEYVVNSHALFALDRYHIWLGTSGGRIYFSDDGGVTWALQENAVISATNIVAISFVDPDIGFVLYTGGQVAKTVDGSSDTAAWTAATTIGAINQRDIHAVTPYFLWAVGTAGRYYSHDGGVTWTRKDTIATAAIDFYSDLLAISVGSGASAPIMQTINGGYDWEQLTTISNAGFTDVKLISPTLGYVTGNASGGTGFIAKLLPAS